MENDSEETLKMMNALAKHLATVINGAVSSLPEGTNGIVLVGALADVAARLVGSDDNSTVMFIGLFMDAVKDVREAAFEQQRADGENAIEEAVTAQVEEAIKAALH